MKKLSATARRVAELRKIIGKSQSQFAAMLGVSKDTIISVENGRNQLSRNLVKRIEIATGAELSDGKLESPFSQADYTRNDFNRWREKYGQTSEDAALKQLKEMQMWLKVIFLAAAKSGRTGNRDRLPALSLSLVEWLDEARQKFNLQDEIEEALHCETRKIGRKAHSIKALLDEPDRAKKELAEHDIDFNKIKNMLKKHKSNGWLIIDDEVRTVWSPGSTPFTVPCNSRKLISKAKFWVETIPPDVTTIHRLMELLKSQPLTLAQNSELTELMNSPMVKLRKILDRVETDYPTNPKSKT
jgi:transcriptional regulator with XRE-family HTH domain